MVKRRQYRLGKRADAATATRRRILESTLALHDEQGITRTSVRDVAGRAGVSPATVLNHFARMDDLIRACGQLSDDLYPMPTDAVLIGARDRTERVRLLAEALFTWWEGMASGWEHLQIDRRTLPEVDAWLRDVDARHRTLMATALGVVTDDASVAIATALTSFGSWRSLSDAGLDASAAAAQVARFVADSPLAPTNQPKEKGRLH